jgi:glycosyltransferase involved in cell wall biosynthesis
MPNKLTIITINRNNADGLRKTMESVFAQTVTDFEYIVVDGASTDNSVEVIQSFISIGGPSILSSLVWISESDRGVYQAMNKGIKMATGEFLLFLNSGDFLSNEKVIEKLFSVNHFADILCGRCNITDNGKIIHTTNPPQNITFGTLYTVGLAHQSTFIKRNLFDKLGMYREDFKYNSDIDFWYRAIILNGATTEKLDEIISDYNLDGLSSTENKTPEFLKEHKEILSNPLYQKFIPDYDSWKLERSEMNILYWVKSKTILYAPLKLIYKLALRFNGK